MDMLQEIRGEARNESDFQTELKTAGALVGVIPATNYCAGHPFLEVFLDCEDKNHNNYSNGWIGATEVGKDVKLKFCLVPKSLFKNMGNHFFAVLSYSEADHPVNSRTIEREFDNEDKNNTNSVHINGLESKRLANKKLQGIGNGVLQNSNVTNLFFRIFIDGTDKEFPDLGFSYGVLGTFNAGYSSGYVRIDDEDKNNISSAWFNWGIIPNLPWGQGNVDYIRSIIELGEETGSTSTTLYFTRVK